MDSKRLLLITVREASQRLGIAAGTLREWMTLGRIGWVKLTPTPKGAVRIPISEIERILQAGYVPPRISGDNVSVFLQ
jgi:predicted site-specific integrase-resolvase